MRLRIASWNVRGMAHATLQLALLERECPDIILLQDVSRTAARTIRKSSRLGNVLDTWTDGREALELPSRSGCLIAAAHGWQLDRGDQSSGSLTDGRILCATTVYSGTALTLLSCYAPTNTGSHKGSRAAYFASLARQLATTPGPLILGMDANGPRVDHPNLADSVWWTPEEATVLGAEAPTLDALRLWYQDHPEEWRHRLRYYPRGPLADSYHRGRKGKYLRCRYDSIRVSPGIHVLDVRYLYDDAIQAGSDHALVVADLELV